MQPAQATIALAATDRLLIRGDLAYSLLITTKVYLEFRENISWKFTNYL